jgi:predicted DsbA family dithiol-disulfide isomerase
VQPIEVFADIWCPFAHAGLRAVVAHRDRLGRADVPLVVRAWPLELINGAPQDPEEVTAHVADLQEQVAPDLFVGFDAARLPRTTIPALSLAAAAYRHNAVVGERVSLALRDALWEQGRDVSDPAVLHEVGAAHGVSGWAPEDERSVGEDWALGQAREVQGSPHFFCGDAESFCPSLDIDDLGDGHVRVRHDASALDAFLSSCLTPASP